ncbi:MAG: efflux RND transporter permease subunit, partial [Alcanivorax sp.]|nr:efflux RND transporter permease subunit [Alcanivorax sp.]
MTTVNWLQKHRRSILFLIAMLALAGALTVVKMPVALFPNVSFPRLVIQLDAGDRAADQMALTVTRPVELAVRAVPGVKGVRSTTSRGSAEISVDFGWGHDMARALLQVQAAVGALMPTLPANTRFEVVRRDPTVFPSMAYSLTSDKVDLVGLKDIARNTLQPMLSRVDGVAKIGIQGGQDAEFHVTVEPQKLRAMKLSLSDVATALSRDNVLQAVGRIEDHDKLYLAMSDRQPKTADDLGKVVVSKKGQRLVRVRDV